MAMVFAENPVFNSKNTKLFCILVILAIHLITMLYRLLALLLILAASPIVAGLYGILHDQITYTLAPEYYTHFKYPQFRISEHLQNRVGVGIVGFMATWWVGLLLGLVFGLMSLFLQKTPMDMLSITTRCIAYTLIITAILGVIGYFIGRFAMNAQHPAYWFPAGVTDPQRFLAVGMVHNLGYLGGLAGLAVGIFLQLKYRS